MILENKIDKVKRKLLQQRWDPDRINDAVQDAILKALEAHLDLDSISIQWLYITARNLAINKLKRDSKIIPMSNLNDQDIADNNILVDYKLDSTSDKLSTACEQILHPNE